MQINQFRYGVPTSESTLDYYNPVTGHNTQLAVESDGLVIWDPLRSYPIGTGSIIKLGVQAPPNFTFKINGSEITVGVTGVFEIDESITGPITKLELLNWQNNVIIDFITSE